MTDGLSGDVTLVLGGARSGKSAFAEQRADETGLEKVYIATGEAHDDEMRDRIARHKEMRDDRGWTTVEEPLDLAGTIEAEASADRVLLVDCLTLWLSNLMGAERLLEAEFTTLLSVLESARGPVILVSNEVGLGIVPDNRMAREFRDHAGRLNQMIAAQAVRVYFVAAGLPLTLKDQDNE